MDPILALTGLNPNRLASGKLQFTAGSFTSAQQYSRVDLWSPIEVDPNVVGFGGFDATPVEGEDYFPYLIRNASGTIGAVLSASRFYGSDAEWVRLPDGCTMLRKLPFGFVWNPKRGGIPNFHISGWPGRPYIRLTDAESTPLWQPLVNRTSPTWAAIDLAPFIPDNARLVELLIETAGMDGAAYLRSYGGQKTGLRVTGGVLPIRVSSERELFYRCDGGQRLTLTVLGYYQTEQS